MERMSANGCFFHRSCFRCTHCNCQLKIGGYSLSKGDGGEKGKFFCTAHYRQLFMSNPEAIGYQRADAKRDTKGAGSPRPQTTEPSPPVEDKVVVVTEKEDKKKSKSKKKSVKESKSDSEKEKKKQRSSSSTAEDKHTVAENSESEEKKKKKESKEKQNKSDSLEKTEGPPPIVVSLEVAKGPVGMDEDSPRARSASIVKTLSEGFEQLEQHAKDTEIEIGAGGR